MTNEQKLREALQFYAEPKNYKPRDFVDVGVGEIPVPGSEEILEDGGRKARLSLQPPTSDEGTPLTDAFLTTPVTESPNSDWANFARQLERTLHAKEQELADRARLEETIRLAHYWINSGTLDAVKNARDVLRNATDALQSVSAAPQEGKALIDKMVDRFLSWPLPKDFMPDGGISFKPIPNHQPIGTNLLTAEQARKMIEHMQGGR